MDVFLTEAQQCAIKTLQNIPLQNLDELSQSKQAFLLAILPSIPELTTTRQQLAANLEAWLTPTVIEQGTLENVFEVLCSLHMYNHLLPNDLFIAAIQRLVLSEQAPGGPYVSQNGEVTVKANSTIAVFVRQYAAPLPMLEAFFADYSTQQSLAVLSPTTLFWLYQATANVKVHEYITKCWTYWRQPLARATALVLLNDLLSVSTTRRALQWLCKTQIASDWKNLLETAVLLRAIQQYQQRIEQRLLHNKRVAIVRAAQRHFCSLQRPLRMTILELLVFMIRADTQFELTLLGFRFATSLRKSPALKTREYTFLGVASLCGWIAYTVYDDILDNEPKPYQLPAATTVHRTALEIFLQLAPSKFYTAQVKTAFITMDQANAWELAHCRWQVAGDQIKVGLLPDFGNLEQLANRSCAYMLAPLLVLARSHTRLNIQNQVKDGFRHYLIAKQLLDDIYDWQADIAAGRVTYVVACILRELKLQSTTYVTSDLLALMRKQFAQKTMTEISKLALYHCQQANQVFNHTKLFKSHNYVYELIAHLVQSATTTLDKQAKNQALIRFYQK